MPWKVLGRKWHLARKGFPPGKRPAWSAEVLEELLELLSDATGEVASATGESAKPQFLWNNQQVVNLMIPAQREPWAVVHTKRLAGVDLALSGPPGAFAGGRIAKLASQRAIAANGDDRDQVRLRFVTLEDLHRGDLAKFLAEHLAAASSVTAT
jgi:excinuclease ABC subunit A